MKLERLVAMVNDIAAFFAGDAGSGAPAEVASHLRRFWEPRMRTQIIAAYRDDPSTVSGLSETGRAAIAELAGQDDTGHATAGRGRRD
jgi:formate dehydrogenase subunit delta